MAAVVEVTTARVNSTNNVATYATASFTPVAGDLLVVIATARASVTTPATLTASANGITFTQVHDQMFNLSADTNYIFVADQLVGASPAAMTVTLNLGADPGTGAFLVVYRVTGMSKAGTAAVLQASGSDNNTLAGQAPDTTLPANITAGNPVIAAVSNNTNPATQTPPSGFTEDVDLGISSPTGGFETCHIDSHAGGSAYIQWGSTSTRGGAMAVELDASASGTTLPRSAADTVTVSDALTATGTRPRAAADAVTVSDALARAGTRPRGTTDAVTVSDTVSATVVRLLPRSTTDAVTVTDTSTRAAPKARATTDAVTVSDAATRSTPKARATAETVTVTDALARGAQTFLRPLTDAVTVTDATAGSTTGQIARNTAETVTVADTATRSTTRARATTDAVNVSDGLISRLTYGRGIGETVTLSDLAARSAAYARAVLDAATVTDTTTGVYVPPGGAAEPAPPRLTLYVPATGRMVHVPAQNRTTYVQPTERS